MPVFTFTTLAGMIKHECRGSRLEDIIFVDHPSGQPTALFVGPSSETGDLREFINKGQWKREFASGRFGNQPLVLVVPRHGPQYPQELQAWMRGEFLDVSFIFPQGVPDNQAAQLRGPEDYRALGAWFVSLGYAQWDAESSPAP